MPKGILTESEQQELRKVEDVKSKDLRYESRKKAKKIKEYTNRALEDLILLQNLLKAELRNFPHIYQEKEWRDISGSGKSHLYDRSLEDFRDEFFEELKSKLPVLLRWLTFEQRKEIAERILDQDIDAKRSDLAKLKDSIEEQEMNNETVEDAFSDIDDSIDEIIRAPLNQISENLEKILASKHPKAHKLAEEIREQKGRHNIDKYYVFKGIVTENPESPGEIVEKIAQEDSKESLDQQLTNRHTKGSFSSKASQYCKTMKEEGLIEGDGPWEITEKGEKTVMFLDFENSKSGL